MDGKLNYVYAVYQEGSFTRAAEKLYISQPSLSAMVKKAEQALGAVIFDRGTNPLELTEAGRAYIQYIERVRQCEEELNEKLWDIQHLTKGRVRLGGSNYVLSGIVPLILERILPQYPGIEIELVEEKSFTLEKMLQAGTGAQPVLVLGRMAGGLISSSCLAALQEPCAFLLHVFLLPPTSC